MATRIIITVLGLGLAVLLGLLAGEGAVIPVTGMVLLLFFVLLKFTLGRKLTMEAMLCMILLTGILIGQKGFTYFRLASILFVSEVFLATLVIIYVSNTIIRHRPMLPNTWLARVIFVFLIYSVVHLYLDYQKYQFMALRDAGLAYYTLFFILAYRISHQKEALRVLERWLPRLFLFVAVWYGMWNTIPAWQGWINSIRFLGNYPFFPSNDVSMNAAFGVFFYFYWRLINEKNGSMWSLIGTAIACFSLLSVVRGTLVVTGMVTLCLFLFFRRRSVIRYSLIVSGITIIAVAAFFIAGPNKVQEGIIRPFEMILNELKALEMGINQSNEIKNMEDGTAHWRMEWWKKLWKDTIHQAPLTGVGFGADIATEFHMEYHQTYQAAEGWSSIRGAHSALMTIFARLGFIGVVFFVLIMGAIAHRIWISMHLINNKRLPLWYMLPIGYIVGGFIVSFFQYTWEAPYTAIPFWIMVGILYSGTDKILKVDAESDQRLVSIQDSVVYGRKPVLEGFKKFRPDPLNAQKLLARRKRQFQRKFYKIPPVSSDESY